MHCWRSPRLLPSAPGIDRLPFARPVGQSASCSSTRCNAPRLQLPCRHFVANSVNKGQTVSRDWRIRHKQSRTFGGEGVLKSYAQWQDDASRVSKRPPALESAFSRGVRAQLSPTAVVSSRLERFRFRRLIRRWLRIWPQSTRSWTSTSLLVMCIRSYRSIRQCKKPAPSSDQVRISLEIWQNTKAARAQGESNPRTS